jgi:putative NADH-flavin reductase
MNLLVIGASRGTGKSTVEAALRRGHRVSAFARQPEAIGIQHADLRLIAGSALDPTDIANAVAGHDAVIVALGANVTAMRKPLELYSVGTRLVIEAMKAHQLRRLVVLTARGTGDSVAAYNPVLRVLVRGLVLKHNFDDHDRQEALTRESGLDWVIARPSALTNGPARRRYRTETEVVPVPGTISRADVAEFMVDAIETDRWIGKAVLLGG